MRFVMPQIFKAIEAISEQSITAELPDKSFDDVKLDRLILAARAVLNDEDPIDLVPVQIYEGIRWSRISEEPFEYAIQQGPHGDDFVKLLGGTYLRRSVEHVPAQTHTEICMNEKCPRGQGVPIEVVRR